jgi:hypothetical protein
MIRKALRLGATVLCLLSLLASVGTGWVWWRSNRLVCGYAVTIRLADTRYTVRPAAGRLTLFAPPRPASEGAAALFGMRARNNQMACTVVAGQAPIEFGLTQFTWDLGPTYPVRPGGNGLRKIPDEALRPLLDALEDPRRFAAAHLLLCEARYQRSPLIFDVDVVSRAYRPERGAERRGDRLVVWFDGLRLEFPPSGPGVYGWREWSPGREGYVAFGVTPDRPDPGQLPALRALWHERMDVPVASLRLVWLVAAFAVLPTLWIGTYCHQARKRQRRRRLGRCARCGYDLAGNVSGVCPECGRPIDALSVAPCARCEPAV